MKLSMKWLSDFLDISDINIKDFCEKLTFGKNIKYMCSIA